MALAYVDFGLDSTSQATSLTMNIADYDADGAPAVADMSRLSAPLSSILTQELDGARKFSAWISRFSCSLHWAAPSSARSAPA